MVGKICCISAIFKYHSIGTQVTGTLVLSTEPSFSFINPKCLHMLAFTFLQIGTISKDSGRTILRDGGKDNIQTTTLHADKTLEMNEVCFYENKVILLLDFKTMN